MSSHDALRAFSTMIGGAFLVYAIVAVFRGTLYDVDDGRVDRAVRPVTFWLLVSAMTILGLTILAVGWRRGS